MHSAARKQLRASSFMDHLSQRMASVTSLNSQIIEVGSAMKQEMIFQPKCDGWQGVALNPGFADDARAGRPCYTDQEPGLARGGKSPILFRRT